MPLLQSAAQGLTDRLPTVISPRTHAIIDYATAAAFLTMGGVLWRRNRRAALASLLCGGAELLTSLLTDYPGGVAKAITFPAHGRIDAGLAAMTATMPTYFGFDDTAQSRFFRVQGIGMAAVAGLTDFTGTGERQQLKKLKKRAA
ncbi:MAG: hypothetical protein L0Z53_10340 [Acidobacteriales bacterium]|nr:hypothetical protein [Terriglobales bacterium]